MLLVPDNTALLPPDVKVFVKGACVGTSVVAGACVETSVTGACVGTSVTGACVGTSVTGA